MRGLARSRISLRSSGLRSSAHEHRRSLRRAGRARAAGAAEPAARARQHDGARADAAMRDSPIGTWGQRAYEEDIIQGRFFGRSSFILNTPDAIRHVLVDNYENYTRTPAGFRVLRPMLGEGLLIAEGRAWKHQRRTLAPAFTPRAVSTLVPHMMAVTDETIAKLRAASNAPVDLREAMQRMTLEIAGRTMFSFGMERHGAALRDFVMEYGERLARPHLLDLLLPLGWPTPQDFARARFRKRWTALRRDADGRAPRRRQERGRAAARPVRPDGRRARSRDRRGLHRRAARRPGRDHDLRRPRDDGDRAVLVALSAGARSRDPGRGGGRGAGRDRRRRARDRAAEIHPRRDRRDHAALSAGVPDRARRRRAGHDRRACRSRRTTSS